MDVGASIDLGPWTVDLVRQVLTDGAREVSLSNAECGLLRHLAAHAGAPVPREELLRHVLGYATGVESRALDQGLLRLRKKLSRHPSAPDLLRTRRGVGVWLEGVGRGVAAPVAAPPGRAALAEEVASALAAPGLRTLTGPSGIGKTALARAVCARVGGRWVDCAPLRTDGAFAEAVAAALGVGRGELDAQVARGGPLVLDNFEQLEPAAAVRVDAWAARAAVLVTSIAPLRVPSEQVVPVPLLDADTARAVLRDQVARLGLTATDAQLDLVVGAVGGHPLALLLLAPVTAEAGLLDAPQLLDVASDRPTDPERHRSLRATIDRAIGFVPPEAAEALGHAARFVGAFRADALAAVAGAPVAAVVARLRILRRVGLAEADGDAYRLPPVVRLHARRPDPASEARKVGFLLGLHEAYARAGGPAVAPYRADLLVALADATGADRIALFDLAELARASWTELHAALDRCGLLGEASPDGAASRWMVSRHLDLAELRRAGEADLVAAVPTTPLALFGRNLVRFRWDDFDELLALAPADPTPAWAVALPKLAAQYRDPRAEALLDATRERCRARGWWHAVLLLEAALGGRRYRSGDLDGARDLLGALPLARLDLPEQFVRIVSAALTGATGAARDDLEALLARGAIPASEEVLLRATDAALRWLDRDVAGARLAAGRALAVPRAGDVTKGSELARVVLVLAGDRERTGDPHLDAALDGGPMIGGLMAPLVRALLGSRGAARGGH